jgi:glutathione S-transferase
MITLYGAARVPYTEKVRRALVYKRLDFELHEPTCAEDYQRWNPKSGMLPVIHIGDEVIEDSTQILCALDARYPTRRCSRRIRPSRASGASSRTGPTSRSSGTG